MCCRSIAVSLFPTTNARVMDEFKPIVATVTMVLLFKLWIIISWHMFHCTWLMTNNRTQCWQLCSHCTNIILPKCFFLINHLKQNRGISPILIPICGKGVGCCLHFPTPEPDSLVWIPVYVGLKSCMALDQRSQTPHLCYRSAGCDYKHNTNWLEMSELRSAEMWGGE